MQTARFSQVVQRCGEPVPHLVLLAPDKDPELNRAVKTKRLLTVFQNNVGTKADHGVVGFEPGRNRQFLIFPKSLSTFVGKRIVGIKYDLVSQEPVPEAERAAPPEIKKSARKTKLPRAPKSSPHPDEKTAHKTKNKIIAFHPDRDADEADEDSDQIAGLKALVQQAMNALEDGKQVAAFNLLKRIVED